MATKRTTTNNHTTQSLWFYKGTCIGNMPMSILQVNNYAREQIKLGLRNGDSLKEQIKLYKEQLDVFERIFCKYGSNCDEAFDECIDNCATKRNKNEILIWWSVNIACLVIMKAIPNDNMFGSLEIQSR
jgi:hypothetical protein